MKSGRLRSAASHVVMPWKNGGGETREIVRVPEGDGALHFRLSIATVASGGPFSRFPGISRILVVTEGDGMVLAGESWSRRIAPLEAFAFSGDESVSATLSSGPTCDFNVMWDPVRVDLAFTLQEEAFVASRGAWLVVLRGSVEIGPLEDYPSVAALDAGASATLERYDALETYEAVRVLPGRGSSVVEVRPTFLRRLDDEAAL